MNVALFPNAEVVDFWARYKDDLWLDMPGDGYRLSPKAQLWLTPGHTAEDASLIVEADDGVYAMTHLWWHADRSPDLDPYRDDQARSSRRVAPGCWASPTSSSPATAASAPREERRNPASSARVERAISRPPAPTETDRCATSSASVAARLVRRRSSPSLTPDPGRVCQRLLESVAARA